MHTGYEAHAMRMHESNQQQAYKLWRIWGYKALPSLLVLCRKAISSVAAVAV